MSYGSIKQNGYWKDTANTLNYNFNRIDTEISELDGKVTKAKGLFKTDALLKQSIPNPEEGDWALVGTGFPAQVWVEQDGTWVNSGGTSGDTIDLNLSEYLQSEEISNVVDILEINLLKVTITCSPKIVEYTGSNQSTTITWTATEGDVPVSSLDTFRITQDGSNIEGLGIQYNGSKTLQINKEGNTNFTITAAKDGKPAKTATVYYGQWKGMYFGTSTESNAENITYTSFTKQAIKSGPNGNYTLTNEGTGNYLWLCIPNNMIINRVKYTSGAEILINMTPKDGYRLYRSEEPVTDGELRITIY